MTIHLSIVIAAPRAKVFAVLTDLAAYSTWLPQSSAFKGTTSVSESPVRLGTTYLEPGPAGLRKGEVVEFEQDSKVTFHQPMTMKPYFLGVVLDVRVEMVLKEGEGGGTVLERDVKLGYPVLLRLVRGLIDGEFRRESWRTMETLKEYVEGLEG
jgi:uncharacterized protein YndB with AHSA1/START domain